MGFKNVLNVELVIPLTLKTPLTFRCPPLVGVGLNWSTLGPLLPSLFKDQDNCVRIKILRAGQHQGLRPGWKILPSRMGYCSNTNWGYACSLSSIACGLLLRPLRLNNKTSNNLLRLIKYRTAGYPWRLQNHAAANACELITQLWRSGPISEQ